MRKLLLSLPIIMANIIYPTISLTSEFVCDNPILLDRELSEVIKLKLEGKDPDYDRITYSIINANEKKGKIDLLKKNFDSISPKNCYKSDFLPIVYVSDAIKGHLQITNLVNNIGFRGGPSNVLMKIDKIYNIEIKNSSDFNEFNTVDLINENQIFTDLSKNSKQVEGFMKLYLSGFSNLQNKLLFPTLQKDLNEYSRGVITTKACSVDFFDKNKKKLFGKIYPIALDEKIDSTNSYKNNLAKSENPSDFDVKGLNAGMGIDEIISIGKKNGWYSVDNQIREMGRLQFCSHDCGLSYDLRPAGYYEIDVNYHTVNGKKRVSEIRFDGMFSLQPEDMKNMILNKYGIPLEHDKSDFATYYWGSDISKWINASKAHIFRMHITQYDVANKKGETFSVGLELTNPVIPDQRSLQPINQSL